MFNKIPIIFTAARERFVICAFKLEGRQTDKANFLDSGIDDAIVNKYGKYKSRFLVKERGKYFVVPVDDIAFFEASNALVLLNTVNGQRYFVNSTLDKLELLLDPHSFYRINRSYVVSYKSIGDINICSTGKLNVKLLGPKEIEVFVSREKVTSFKNWLDS